MIDIDVGGLPTNCDELTLKKVANVKHVIQSTIETDNLKGICTGKGRLRVRLNEDESLEQVRLNLVKAGYQVQAHQEDPRKRPIVTGIPKEEAQTIVLNAKEKKAQEMATKHGGWAHHAVAATN